MIYKEYIRDNIKNETERIALRSYQDKFNAIGCDEFLITSNMLCIFYITLEYNLKKGRYVNRRDG